MVMMVMIGPSTSRCCRRVVNHVGGSVTVRKTKVTSDVTRQRVGAWNCTVDVIMAVVQML